MFLQKVLSPVFSVFLLFASWSCSPSAESNPAWQELFQLVQNGKMTQGKVLSYRAPQDSYPYMYMTPDLVEVQLEMVSADGSAQTFWELWPIQEKKNFPEGTAIDIYEWSENKTLPRASKTLLRSQKVMQ